MFINKHLKRLRVHVHYLDLLFYHRRLRRLVAVDLKLRDFQPTDKGQMEFYLRWLARHEQQPGEEPSIGLILCAGKKHETVELLELEKSHIRVASYWTKLLPRRLLQRKLRKALTAARSRLADKSTERLPEPARGKALPRPVGATSPKRKGADTTSAPF